MGGYVFGHVGEFQHVPVPLDSAVAIVAVGVVVLVIILLDAYRSHYQ